MTCVSLLRLPISRCRHDWWRVPQVVLSLEPRRRSAYERRIAERKLVTVELLPVPIDPGHMLSYNSGLSLATSKSMRLSAVLLCLLFHPRLISQNILVHSIPASWCIFCGDGLCLALPHLRVFLHATKLSLHISLQGLKTCYAADQSPIAVPPCLCYS